MATASNKLPALPIGDRTNLVTLPVVPKPARTNVKWLKWALLVGIAAALALTGFEWRAHVQTAIHYETVSVERGLIQANVTATGTLNAVVDVLISSQVSGNIKALYADWNTKVKKGQLVALIDPEIFQSQVDQAQATYRSAHAATVTAQAQVEKANADQSSAVANEKNAEAVSAKDAANAANAKAQLSRAEILLQEQVMDQQDYDTAKANDAAAQAQVSADQSSIDAANHAIASAQANVVVAQNQLASAQDQERETQAALQQAQINLDHTRIMAPVDGTVIARRMDVGQTVASSLNPPTIFEIAQDLTKMQVDTNVDESDVGNIALGQKATFTVDSYPDAVFHGVVADVRKAPIITQNVVTYDVVITVDNTDLKLFPGMTANVTISTRRLDDTLKVPNSVLRFRPSAALIARTGLPPVSPGKPQVYVLAGTKLKAVPAAFGISDGKFTSVTSAALQTGDQVVVRATIGEGAPATSTSAPMPTGPRM